MFQSINDVKAANEAIGGHFFDPVTMTFFDSRIESEIIDGHLFITSERGWSGAPRLYTIRTVDERGNISTVGDFQAYDTLAQAMAACVEVAVES